MRKKIKKINRIKPDFKYNSEIVERFINYIMKAGKKSVARSVMYGALEDMEKKTKSNPIETLELAMKNTSPLLEVKSRRVGGANYQVPREVRPERRFTLAARWILEAARAKKGSKMSSRLSDELISASKNEGAAVKKKENTHKMAEANKAFAHFAW